MLQLRRSSTSLLLLLAALGFAPAALASPLPTLTEWGSAGTAAGQFRMPLGVAVANDAVYVADYENDRIQKFSLDGRFLLEWGHSGSAPGELLGPASVAVDADGDVYVADLHNHRVQKFSSDGRALAQWGTRGNRSGELDSPYGIAVDRAGHVFVTDLGNDRIQKFTDGGEWLAGWGSPGMDRGQLLDPWGIAVDAAGNVYVADHGNHRVQKFSGDGAFLDAWGASGDRSLIGPASIAVRPSGAIYVVDLGGRRLQKLSPTGMTLERWELADGNAAGGFPHRAVGLDRNGRLFVADAARHSIGARDDRTSDFTAGVARLPAGVQLSAARPNPSEGLSALVFATPRAGRLDLEIFDISGRLIHRLDAGAIEAGEHYYAWDGRTDDGTQAPAGMYLVRARYADDVEHRTLQQRIVRLR